MDLIELGKVAVNTGAIQRRSSRNIRQDKHPLRCGMAIGLLVVMPLTGCTQSPTAASSPNATNISDAIEDNDVEDYENLVFAPESIGISAGGELDALAANHCVITYVADDALPSSASPDNSQSSATKTTVANETTAININNIDEELQDSINTYRYETIVIVGSDYLDAVDRVASQNLQQEFVIIGAQLPEPTENVTAITWEGAASHLSASAGGSSLTAEDLPEIATEVAALCE